MFVFALSFLAEVSDSLVEELRQSGLVLHFHWCWHVVISLEDLIIRVLEERSLVVVLLHEDMFSLLCVISCI